MPGPPKLLDSFGLPLATRSHSHTLSSCTNISSREQVIITSTMVLFYNGETWTRLMVNCNHMQLRSGATATCGNTQLYARLRAGIQANLHALKAIRPQSAQELVKNELTNDVPGTESKAEGMGPTPAAALEAANAHIHEDKDHVQLGYSPQLDFDTALFDTCNAFNKLNRYPCYGMWPTYGTAAVSLHSIDTATGGCALCEMSQGRKQ